VRQGDIVQVVNSQGPTMTPFDNGIGDWNLDEAKWLQGSALGKASSTASRGPANPMSNPARLRPETV
jgi:hypothetical protein